MPAHCESNIFIQDTERIPVFVRNDVSTSHVETITRTTRIVNRRHCTLAFDRVAIRVVCTHNYDARCDYCTLYRKSGSSRIVSDAQYPY